MNIIEAEVLANQLMREYGLPSLGWKFKWDRAVRRFGCCHYRTSTITLSQKITELNEEPQVKDTILHEIAHALVGINVGHGLEWHLKARSIGCSGSRCYDDTIITPRVLHHNTFEGSCPKCNRTIHRFRRDKIACGQCCKKYNNNKFSSDYLFTWEEK